MAKLPTVDDLGPTPGVLSQRPVADVSAGGDALAAGGRALGAGLEKAGEGIAQASYDTARLEFAKTRWEHATSQSQLVSGLVDLNDTTKQDTNPGPDDNGVSLVNRHAEAAWQKQSEAAAGISDPRMRQHFIDTTQPLVQRSIEQARDHARSLENNQAATWSEQQGTDAINKGITAPDDATRRDLIDAQNGVIDGLVARGVYTPLVGLAKKREFASQFVHADYLHRADTDPEGVINELRPVATPGEDVTNRILRAEGTGKNAASSATGAGQFIDSTWLDVLKRNRPDLAQGRSDDELLALRADKTLGRQMTDAYRRENSDYLSKQGVEPTPGAQYLAHFLGPAGAAATLKADPNAPISDVLKDAVGPKAAQQMIDANPSILQGKLAGSVTKWADGKMGGVSAGASGLTQFLDPVTREEIISRAQATIAKQDITDKAQFQARVANAEQEAFDTGTVTKPLSVGDFVARYGAEDGPQKYREHDIAVQTGRAVNAMGSMSAPERQAAVDALAPKQGDPDYAVKAQSYEIAQKASKTIDDNLKKDPAGYAAAKLPASKDAYQAFRTAGGPNGPDRGEAAQHYAAVTLAEQAKVGVPEETQSVVPKSYADALTGSVQKVATSDDPNIRVGLVGQIQAEAKMWGQYWPQVMRQMAPQVQPVVRAIAAGADPNALTRLLSLDPKEESPAKILKEQNETKFSDLQKQLNESFAPFRQTLVGRQVDRDFPGYYDLGTKLGALYVRDGMSASDAAAKAFTDLVGKNYDFRDTYRIPKSAGVDADAVQLGAQAARTKLSELGAMPPVVTIPGRTNAQETDLQAASRDGKWVTAPDSSGLNLALGDRFLRSRGGSPLKLSWADLDRLGKDPGASAAAVAAAVGASAQTP